MGKFGEKIYRFMSGRNGSDSLCRALLTVCLILLVVNIFVGSIVIYAVELALIVYATFRMLSRNLVMRGRENAAYKRVAGRVTGFFKLQKNRIRDRKTHVYRKCPTCKNNLRLPKSKGHHTVNCPCCHNKFDVSI